MRIVGWIGTALIAILGALASLPGSAADGPSAQPEPQAAEATAADSHAADTTEGTDASVTTTAAGTAETDAVEKAAAPATPPPGWQQTSRNGVTYWCVVENPTGTRVRKVKRCMTPEQYATMQDTNRDGMDDLLRRSVPPSGN